MTHKALNRYWGSRKPPQDRSQIFNVVAPKATDESTTATIRLYGPIDSWGGWWGVSAEEVGQALDGLGDHITDVVLRVNSPGGEVFEGLAILNMLRAHRAKVTAVVDGLAASAASLIAVGCDETVMSPGTQLMIHDARVVIYGPPEDLRKEAAVLDSISDSAAEIYAEAAGGAGTDWRELMTAETWYSATEAVTARLAARVAVVPDAGETTTAGETEIVVEFGDIEDMFDLSLFAYAGRAKAPAPALIAAAAAPHLPAASAGGPTPSTPEGAKLVDFTDEHIATLREQVGFPENADAETITAALIEALDERADYEPTTPAAPAAGTAANTAASAVASTAAPADGMTVIPAVAYAELQANAQAGAQAAEQLRLQERATFLDAHRDRFLPANRAQWESEYDRHPANTRAYLEKAPVLVPTSELGHSVPTAEAAGKDDSWFPQFPTTVPKGA